MNPRQLLRLERVRPEWIVNNVLLVALVVLVVYFASRSAAFLTVGNFKIILQSNATLGIVAVALTLLVISGGVDLSIGSTVGLSGLVTALSITKWGLTGLEGMVVGILAGGLIGIVNGLLCGVLQLNPVVVTLGMLGVVRGVTLLIHHDQVFGIGGPVETLGNGSVLGIPTLAVVALVVFAIGGGFLRYAAWGRYVYAIGANREAAYLAALPVRAVPFALYVATGLAAGLAGVLLVARLDGVAPGDQGVTLELQALTVVLLGGVAFAGGRGRMFGVFVGWIFLGVLENGLVLTNVTPFVETLIEGLALVFAAALDQLGSYMRTRLQQSKKTRQQLDGDASVPSAPPDLSATAVSPTP